MIDDGFKAWPPAVLDPAGPFAAPVSGVTMVLLWGAIAIVCIVVVLMIVALFGPRPWRRRLGGARMVWIAGLALPALVLSVLLVYGLTLTGRLSEPPRPGEMRVRVIGEMWWWRVIYLTDDGRVVMTDANEIHIPTGRPVVFELESADVIHSFWIPRLGGKMDMIPGRRNILRLQADQSGPYSGQCAEFCGGPHALMGLVVVAHPPAEFEAWRARRLTPSVPTVSRGAEVFRASGCGACHAIAGTDFNGTAGPDLTHVGSRRTLGAGILPNNAGTIAGWISDSQAIKPGNRMPPYPVLSGEDLRAVALYLEARR